MVNISFRNLLYKLFDLFIYLFIHLDIIFCGVVLTAPKLGGVGYFQKKKKILRWYFGYTPLAMSDYNKTRKFSNSRTHKFFRGGKYMSKLKIYQSWGIGEIDHFHENSQYSVNTRDG